MTLTEPAPTPVPTDERRVADLVDELLTSFPPAATEPTEFLAEQFDRGLAWVHFPVGHGGLGISPKHQKFVNERLGAAGAPNAMMRNPIGYGMCAPTVIGWGSDDQKQRYLRPLFTGEEVWCQLFSEPGAGSDFAGLAARGVKDGDEWVVNGQKVWTSLAHVSKWGLLVVRTDAEAVKHAGLTAFVVDMEAPGVEVRPLRQMTGDAEFNEVYFTDARIPAREMLGRPGDGWRVSLTTLMNERVSIGGIIPQRGSGVIAELIKVWQSLPAEQRTSAACDEVMKLWSRAEVLRLTNIRAAAARRMGDPGPEGSIAKAASATLNKDVLSAAVTLSGAHGMLAGDYTMRRPRFSAVSDNLVHAFLRSRANSIEGGTTEVMYNILGERVLGLPGDVRVDRDVPWSQVPRN
jgi:alkylation response protein AidB-like acyl-CoA dehydrogenase